MYTIKANFKNFIYTNKVKYNNLRILQICCFEFKSYILKLLTLSELQILFVTINLCGPSQCCSAGWVSPSTPKGCQFGLRPGQKPELWARFLVGVMQKAAPCLTLISMFLSLPSFLFL